MDESTAGDVPRLCGLALNAYLVMLLEIGTLVSMDIAMVFLLSIPGLVLLETYLLLLLYISFGNVAL